MMRSTLLAGCFSLGAAAAAGAQGSIATQGFGYPAGGLSTRAGAAAGAFGEFDFSSVRNPSSLLGWGRGGMSFQYEPEFRSVSSPRGTDDMTTARFPLLMATMQLGSRFMLGLSSTTLLDRTWATRVRSGQILGSDSVGFEETVQSSGAINDLRLAGAWSLGRTFSVGLGIHGYTGQNRMTLIRRFDDSVSFGTLARGLTITYSGSGVSLGATWRPHRLFALATSYRRGGKLDLRISDENEASADIPNRFGAAVRYDGIAGASVAVSAERTEWSSMGALSTSSLGFRDGWDYGAGVELAGPRLREAPGTVYLGFRRRDLPFSVSGEPSRESFITAGLGVPLAGPAVLLDIALQRVSRSSIGDVSERAWLLSLGLTVRP